TAELMRDSAALARRAGVRMHTHLAETLDEEEFCRATFGATPAEYAEDLGWLGDDVWLAHCVHLSDAAIARFAATGTGVAHCPTSNARLGSGIARLRDLLDAGVPVGLGVDGAASNESGRMVDELHQALLAARFRGGPLALTARESLRAATAGGARCLGRDAELGTLEVGKLADVAGWRAAASPTRSARSCSARPRWPTCSSAATRRCATASCARPTRSRSPPPRVGRPPGSPGLQPRDGTAAVTALRNSVTSVMAARWAAAWSGRSPPSAMPPVHCASVGRTASRTRCPAPAKRTCRSAPLPRRATT